jgi:hypothetical protein
MPAQQFAFKVRAHLLGVAQPKDRPLVPGAQFEQLVDPIRTGQPLAHTKSGEARPEPNARAINENQIGMVKNRPVFGVRPGKVHCVHVDIAEQTPFNAHCSVAYGGEQPRPIDDVNAHAEQAGRRIRRRHKLVGRDAEDGS